MAFISSQVALEPGLQQLLQLVSNEKTYMGQWQSALAGNITAIQALSWAANLSGLLPVLDSLTALPGMQAYAQAQFGNATYDIAGNYATMRAAMAAILTWLQANIPSGAITVTNAVQVGATYTPTQTAGLLALVNAAIATIA